MQKATLNVKQQRVTPVLAATMLENNPTNRRLNPTIVTRYANLMREGLWVPNGAPLKFSKTGKLLDGQHRLAAQVESNTTLEHVVVSNLEDEVFDTIDTGKSRTAADALFASGMTQNASLVAAVANIAIKADTDTLKVNQYIEPHRVRAWVAERPEVHAAVERVRAMSFLGFQPILGFLYLKAKAQDPAKADTFFTQLETGENLTKGDPALTLRETLVKHRHDRSYHKADVLRMGMTAWESYVKDSKLAVLKRNMKPKAYAS